MTSHFRCAACRQVREVPDERTRLRTPGQAGFRLALTLPSGCCAGAEMSYVSMVRHAGELIPFDDLRALEERVKKLAAGIRLATSEEWYGHQSPRPDWAGMVELVQRLRKEWGLPPLLP